MVGNQIFYEVVVFIQVGVCLSDNVVVFFDSRQVVNFVSNYIVGYFMIWCFKEVIFVGLCVYGQGVNQIDVWIFRCFDWIYVIVVGWVYVLNFEVCVFMGQIVWVECGDMMFVCNFRQWVVLVYKLRQLVGIKEFFYCCGNWFGVDYILRYQGIQIVKRQMFFYCMFYMYQVNVELVFCYFVNGMDMMVVEVVDIVYFVFIVMDIDEFFYYFDDVVFVQDIGIFDFVVQQRMVEFYMINCGQIVVVFREEQVFKQIFSGFMSWWFVRVYYVVDFYQCVQMIVSWVDVYCFRDVWVVVQIVGEQCFDMFVVRLVQFSQQIQIQFYVCWVDQFVSCFIDIVFSCYFVCDIFNWYFDMFDIVFFQLMDMMSCDVMVFFNVYFVVGFDIEGGSFIVQMFWNQFYLQFVVVNFKDYFFEEQVKDLFSGVIQCVQDDGSWQFMMMVDMNEQVVFWVEFEVQSGIVVRDDMCVIQNFIGGVGFIFVIVKEDVWVMVQLRNDNMFGIVDNKGIVVGYEWNFVYVDFLFFNVFDGVFWCFVFVDYQMQFYVQWCRISYVMDLIFFNVKNWFVQMVVDVLQFGIIVVVLNWEYGMESSFQIILFFRILFDKFLE